MRQAAHLGALAHVDPLGGVVDDVDLEFVVVKAERFTLDEAVLQDDLAQGLSPFVL